MTTLRDALLARLAEIGEAAEAATPGPWDHNGWFFGTGSDESYAVWQGRAPLSPDETVRPPLAKTSRVGQGWNDARLIALSRNLLGPLVEGLAEEVERHGSEIIRQAPAWAVCLGCAAPKNLFLAGYDCEEVRRWAGRLGVTVEEGT